jgi:hypothetical protein
MDDRPIEFRFDDELCELIERYSGDALMSAGEIIAVMEFVKHRVIHRATDVADDK